jgi:WD40 repeat protein
MQIIYEQDPLPSGFTSVSWSPDDHFIAAGSYDTTIWIFDLEQETHTATLRGHGSTVTSIDWNSDGTRLVSGGNWDQLVFLWDMTTYQPIRSLEMTAFINNVAFSPDGHSIAVGNEIGFYIFSAALDPGDGREQNSYRYIEGRSGAIAWSSDGQRIAFGNQTICHLSGNRPDAHLFIMDVNNRSLIQDIGSSWGSIAGLAWSPDDLFLAVYHQDDLVTVLEGKTGSVLETFTGSGPSRYSIGGLDFSLYGGRLAYGVTIDPQQQLRGATVVRRKFWTAQ